MLRDPQIVHVPDEGICRPLVSPIQLREVKFADWMAIILDAVSINDGVVALDPHVDIAVRH